MNMEKRRARFEGGLFSTIEQNNLSILLSRSYLHLHEITQCAVGADLNDRAGVRIDHAHGGSGSIVVLVEIIEHRDTLLAGEGDCHTIEVKRGRIGWLKTES